MKIRMFIGNRQMLITQDFQTLFKVLELGFGDGKNSEPEGKVVQTEADLMAWMSVFNK